jgi:hypothetical protein
MPISLTTNAEEQSTYAVTVAFKDDEGTAVVPNSATWTLTDQDGAVMNSRLDEVISPASSVTIVLQGDDLALDTDEIGSGRRILTIEAVYDSNIGSNLPLRESAAFTVLDLKAVT